MTQILFMYVVNIKINITITRMTLLESFALTTVTCLVLNFSKI